jgi:hypothetical protein
MKAEDIITLKGISKRGKARVNEHGEQFKVVQVQAAPHILVESLGNTWRGEKWLGWLELDVEVKLLDVVSTPLDISTNIGKLNT